MYNLKKTIIQEDAQISFKKKIRVGNMKGKRNKYYHS